MIPDRRAARLARSSGADSRHTELARQRLRGFLKEALFQGQYHPWDYQPVFDATHAYVRRTSNRQWDPRLGR